MKELSPEEYEDFVERVLREMNIWNSATVYRNKRFPGVRQAGSYEIDIALHLSLTDLVSFMLIVECKNHSRPITRPIVQQLAQTRDAIAAQKGAIVSPVGFTDEAIAVARDLGIALWIMGQDIPTVVVEAFDGFKIISLSNVFRSLRQGFLEIFNLAPNEAPSDSLKMFNITTASDPTRLKRVTLYDVPQPPSYVNFARGVAEGSAFFTYQNSRLFDHACAVNQIVRSALDTTSSMISVDSQIQRRLDTWRTETTQWALEHDAEPRMVEYVESDNWSAFFSDFGIALYDPS